MDCHIQKGHSLSGSDNKKKAEGAVSLDKVTDHLNKDIKEVY